MRRPAALLVAALALAGCVSADTYRTKEREAARYKADWEAEQARAAEIRAQFEALRAEVDAMQAEANALQQKARADQALLASRQAELEKKSAEYQQLALSLQTEIESDRVELTELKGRLTVKMKDRILFSPGSATVGRDGRAALAKVADALRGVTGKVIRVDGHTDNVPVGSGPWRSNWELSTARAVAVVRVLQEQGVPPERLGAAGYGEYQPIAGNATPEGRSLNRRIEIVLVPGS
jgi:chemotaxis protein MotB